MRGGPVRTPEPGHPHEHREGRPYLGTLEPISTYSAARGVNSAQLSTDATTLLATSATRPCRCMTWSAAPNWATLTPPSAGSIAATARRRGEAELKDGWLVLRVLGA